MTPFDPRLTQVSRRVGHCLALITGLAVLGAGLAVAQAMLLSAAIVAVFLHGGTLTTVRPHLAALAGVAVGRAAVAWGSETAGHVTARHVVRELRQRVLRHVLESGPASLAEERTGEMAVTLTQGLDALDGYFARFLPQVVSAVVVPVAIVVWVLRLDVIAAVTLGVTAPLIPVFMVLIGLAAQEKTRRRWHALTRLSAHFFDVVQGLATLRVFGRAEAQVDRLRQVGEAYRATTMATLRLAFVSSFVLELLAMLGTALVAVGIGVRLVDGSLGLQEGLAILLLAPEVYLPLRQVGSSFHASMDGLVAADRVFAILERRTPSEDGPTVVPAPSPTNAGAVGGGGASFSGPRMAHRTPPPRCVRVPPQREICFRDVHFAYPGRGQPTLAGLDLLLGAGERLLLRGPSGAGKSTVVSLLLRFLVPERGRILLGDDDLRAIPVDVWRRAVAWAPQRPRFFSGTIADNIRLGRPDAPMDAVRRAAEVACADDFIAELRRGYDTPIGENGAILSAGQRQRLAIARALLRDSWLVVLDEPFANLDGATREELARRLEPVTRERSLLLVSHDPQPAGWVDRVVVLANGAVTDDPTARASASLRSVVVPGMDCSDDAA